MAVKIYYPTQEQLDRWAEEMKDWRNAKLANRDYYDAIDADMALLEKPTLGDAIESMIRLGNANYATSFKNVKREVPLEGEASLEHEITHIAGRVGHTPEQEMWGLYFSKGLSKGIKGVTESNSIFDKGAFKREMLTSNYEYQSIGKKYQIDPRVRVYGANERQSAIYLAAGMYLRQKIDRYNELGLSDKPYELQKQFADLYATSEPVQADFSTTESAPRKRLQKFLNEKSPYAMIKISDREWKAIIAVATGILTPEQMKQTDMPEQKIYADRLKPIAEALKAVGYDYDVKEWAERAVQNHAAHHPKGEAFNPEKFKAARAKRGLETPER